MPPKKGRKNKGEVVPLPRDRFGGDTIIRRCTFPFAITSSGGGVVATIVISSGISTTPATEFASISARYTTYRVLAIKMTYVPRIVVNTTTAAAVVGPLIVGYDPSGLLAAPTTYSAALALRSKVMCSFKPWKATIKASEEDHLLWTESAVTIPTTNRFQMLITGLNQPTSATIGDLFIEYTAEWRGAQ